MRVGWVAGLGVGSVVSSKVCVGSGDVGSEGDGSEAKILIESKSGEDFGMAVVGVVAYKHLSMLNAHRRHIGFVSSH
jgi:hypothetical protein